MSVYSCCAILTLDKMAQAIIFGPPFATINIMNETIKKIFSISNAIRYVAIYRNGKLESSVKPNLLDASGSESDKYEELFVNPSILTLTKQRGELDCGGLEFVLIRYGNFYQLVMPLSNGHASIAIDSNAEPLTIGKEVQKLLILDKTA